MDTRIDPLVRLLDTGCAGETSDPSAVNGIPLSSRF